MNKESTVNTVFAWCCFGLALFFCRMFPVVNKPLGGFLFTIAIFGATTAVLLVKKIKIPMGAIIVEVFSVLLSLAFIVSDNRFLSLGTLVGTLVGYCYFVYSATGNKLEKGLSDLLFFDYLKAMFIFPFYSLEEFFKVLGQKKTKSGTAVALKVLCGLGIAIIPTIIVFLLLSYDKDFTKIMDDIFSFNFSDIISWIVSIGFSIPVGMYIYGLFHTSCYDKGTDIFTKDYFNNGLNKVKILPGITALTATAPILFIYVIYFISQWKYYVSGFTGVLPEEFSYAAYAREGFFQLCAVSFINLLIILTITLFIKRAPEKSSLLLKILSVIFCVFTLVLISTATAKLVMYIKEYGLTQKRIYAMWFMMVIALVYIVVALGQFISRLKAFPVCVAIVLLLFAGLSLSNMNGVIAGYNVDRYIDGSLKTVDIEALENLGDAAVPSLVKLEKHLEAKASENKTATALLDCVDSALDRKCFQLFAKNEDNSFWKFSIPSYMARKSLKETDRF